MANRSPRFPPGLCDPFKQHSEPETATHFRERRRVALVVRELTQYFDKKLSEKIDVAIIALVTIANQQLFSLNDAHKQPDEELSPERPVATVQLTKTAGATDALAKTFLTSLTMIVCGT